MPEPTDILAPGREYRAVIDGRPALVVGHLHADRSTAVAAFDAATEPASGAVLFALVSVQWAPRSPPSMLTPARAPPNS